MGIIFLGDQILFEGSQIAMDPACCCECCGKKGQDVMLHITNSTCPNYADGDYRMIYSEVDFCWHGGPLCSGAADDTILCCIGETWTLTDDDACLFEPADTVSCNPFSIAGSGTWPPPPEAAECCGCQGKTFDWEVTDV